MANKRNLRDYFTRAELLGGLRSLCAAGGGTWVSREVAADSVTKDYTVYAVHADADGRLTASYAAADFDGERIGAAEFPVDGTSLTVVLHDLAQDLFRELDDALMIRKTDLAVLDVGRYNAVALDGAVKRIDQLLGLLEGVDNDGDALLIAQEAMAEGLIWDISGSAEPISAVYLRDTLETSRNVLVRMVREASSEHAEELFASTKDFYRENGHIEGSGDYPRLAMRSYLKTQGYTDSACDAILDHVIDRNIRAEISAREAERKALFDCDILFVNVSSLGLRQALSMFPMDSSDTVFDARTRPDRLSDPAMSPERLDKFLHDSYNKKLSPAPGIAAGMADGRYPGDIDNVIRNAEWKRVIVLYDCADELMAQNAGQDLTAAGFSSVAYRSMDTDGGIRTRSHTGVVRDMIGEDALKGKDIRDLYFKPDGSYAFEQEQEARDPFTELIGMDCPGTELLGAENIVDGLSSTLSDSVRGALIDRPFDYRGHCLPPSVAKKDLEGPALLSAVLTCAGRNWSVPVWFPAEALDKVGLGYAPSSVIKLPFRGERKEDMLLKSVVNAGYFDTEEAPFITHFEEMNRLTALNKVGRHPELFAEAMDRFNASFPAASALDRALAKVYFSVVTYTDPGEVRLQEGDLGKAGARGVFDSVMLTGSRCAGIAREMMLSLRCDTSIQALKDVVEENLKDSGKDTVKETGETVDSTESISI